MEIEFKVRDVTAKLQRNWFWGGMRLVTQHERAWLQHPINPLTHLSLRLKRSWQCQIDGQEVVIEKVRPLLLAGLRPHNYKVFVGAKLVADRKGY